MKTVKILIVENELLTAERIRVSLEKRGYLATVTSSGEETLELLKTNAFDLALMDIHIDGKIDGITTAKISKDYMEYQ